MNDPEEKQNRNIEETEVVEIEPEIDEEAEVELPSLKPDDEPDEPEIEIPTR